MENERPINTFSVESQPGFDIEGADGFDFEKSNLHKYPLQPIQENEIIINMQPESPSFLSTDSQKPRSTTMLPPKDISDYLTYSSQITSTYMGAMSYYSITLDLIAIYLKGQKIIYIESKTFCEQCLYCLMLPAIFISAICTVISTALSVFTWGSVLVSSLTGLNSFILAVVTYLKLDAKSEAHRTASYQFDRLQTMCEFYSGRCLLLSDNNMKDKIENFVLSIEKKVGEIKDVNQFSIPETIRYRYATIYGTNVFSIVKLYKTNRMINTQRLITICKLLEENNFEKQPESDKSSQSSNSGTTVENELLRLNTQKIMDNPFTAEEELEQLQSKLDIYRASKVELLREKDRLINEIIEYRKISLEINDSFNGEISHYIKNQKKKYFNFCSFLKT